ncbi:MAG: hypothetical protein EAZ70_10220 [Runella slithyformis]|nr:MAG: hypothetical protein EAY79_10965 [Runella slithyformis]TAF01552.1 MAG: hypothetical protein EAZ80_02580 [Runella slithyformis]TAF25450.1 MAG: hypothetical protein EAZ70_10220 [Runella slithyformis]
MIQKESVIFNLHTNRQVSRSLAAFLFQYLAMVPAVKLAVSGLVSNQNIFPTQTTDFQYLKN